MKYYRDLNLREIRDKCGLDFAHFTYKRNQCSCCYGPKDMAKRYWKNGVIPDGDDYTYVLFKNANNGSGVVTKNDIIENYTSISYRFKDDAQKELFCRLLEEQLDDDYLIAVPKNNSWCIVIYTKEEKRPLNEKNYYWLSTTRG